MKRFVFVVLVGCAAGPRAQVSEALPSSVSDHVAPGQPIDILLAWQHVELAHGSDLSADAPKPFRFEIRCSSPCDAPAPHAIDGSEVITVFPRTPGPLEISVTLTRLDVHQRYESTLPLITVGA